MIKEDEERYENVLYYHILYCVQEFNVENKNKVKIREHCYWIFFTSFAWEVLYKRQLSTKFPVLYHNLSCYNEYIMFIKNHFKHGDAPLTTTVVAKKN